MELLEILYGAVVGIFSGSIVLFCIYLLQFKFPKLFSMNPFHFLGSVVFIDSSLIYFFGSLFCFLASGSIGIVYAYTYSFDQSLILTTIFLIVFQYIFFGFLIGFFANFHPAVNSKEISKPGFFWITDTKFNGFLFFVINLSFGLIISLIYLI